MSTLEHTTKAFDLGYQAVWELSYALREPDLKDRDIKNKLITIMSGLEMTLIGLSTINNVLSMKGWKK